MRHLPKYSNSIKDMYKKQKADEFSSAFCLSTYGIDSAMRIKSSCDAFGE